MTEPYCTVDDLLPFLERVLVSVRQRRDPRRSLVRELDRRKCLQTVMGNRMVHVDKLQQEWPELWIAWDNHKAEA